MATLSLGARKPDELVYWWRDCTHLKFGVNYSMWYHFLDDSGDPGLDCGPSSTSHFVLAMVQLAERAELLALQSVRQAFRIPPEVEFRYFKTKSRQKTAFFQAIRTIPFRVRAAVVTKSDLPKSFTGRRGEEITINLITQLALRAPESEIADDILVLDGATPQFRRALRLRLSNEFRKSGRDRPFKKIVSGDSLHEDGLQLADMIAGALRHRAMGEELEHYRSFASKVVDLWQVGAEEK